MPTIVVIMLFLSGLVLLFVLGWLVGNLLRLDSFYKYIQKHRPRIQPEDS